MQIPEIESAYLEDREDIVVVGSGFSGLNVALHLARGGRVPVIVDAGEIGAGCSTRNGGQVSSEMRPDLDEYTVRYGKQRAISILRTGVEAHRYIGQFIAEEGIDCNYSVCGHFIGAHRPDRMTGLAHFAEQQRTLGTDAEIIERNNVCDFVASPEFHGGIHLPGWSSLHPGRYLAELTRLVKAEGVRIVTGTRVEQINDQGTHIAVHVAGRIVCAEHVVLGTDGYTDSACPWMQRRVVSLASVVMATEAMPHKNVQSLYPRASMVYDTRLNVTYHRPSPDGDRVILGTVVPVDTNNLQSCYSHARANMLRVFPQLANVGLANIWSGFVGATFDRLPHIGQHGRIAYAIGYNGTGVAMTAYLGRALARRMLNQKGAETGLDNLPMATFPYYRGQTWYRRPVLAWHGILDKLPSRKATIG